MLYTLVYNMEVGFGATRKQKWHFIKEKFGDKNHMINSSSFTDWLAHLLFMIIIWYLYTPGSSLDTEDTEYNR